MEELAGGESGHLFTTVQGKMEVINRIYMHTVPAPIGKRVKIPKATGAKSTSMLFKRFKRWSHTTQAAARSAPSPAHSRWKKDAASMAMQVELMINRSIKVDVFNRAVLLHGGFLLKTYIRTFYGQHFFSFFSYFLIIELQLNTKKKREKTPPHL